jgi:hypothetical protein
MPFRQQHHPFAHSKPALKSNFFLGGINGMCRHRTSKKKQRWPGCDQSPNVTHFKINGCDEMLFALG